MSFRLAFTRLQAILIICLIVAFAFGSYYILTLPSIRKPAPPPTPVLPPPVTENLSDKIDKTGIITDDVEVVSADAMVTLTILKGTKALDVEGRPIKSITIEPVKMAGSIMGYFIFPVGWAYNLQPEGATFDPPIKLVIHYNKTRVLELGAAEGELTAVGYYTTEGRMGWEFVSGALDTKAQSMTLSLDRTIRSVLLCIARAQFDRHS